MTDENPTDSADESVPAKPAAARQKPAAKSTSALSSSSLSARAATSGAKAKTTASKPAAAKAAASKAATPKAAATKAAAEPATTAAASTTEAPATKSASTKKPSTKAPATAEETAEETAAPSAEQTSAEQTAAEQTSAASTVAGEPSFLRRRWKLVVAVGVAVLVIVAGILTFVGVRNAIDTAAATTQVLRFDVAYRDTDCSLFESVTTPELRDALLGEPYDCSTWQSIAESLTVDGTYTYKTTVTGTQVNGDEATVSTSETFIDFDGSTSTVAFDYTLKRTDTGWVISDYANA
jgi:hypothetical protein